MKKQVIILAVCLVVAAALGGALWFLMGYEPEGASSSSIAETDPSLRLNENSLNDLDFIRIENETGSYTIRYLGDSQYTIDELADAPLLSSSISSAASPAVALTALSVVSEAPESLAPFGLDKPRARFSAHYTTGNELTIELGNDAPGDNGIYGKLAGSDTVYLLSSYTFSRTLQDKFEFADKTVTAGPVDSSGQSAIPERVALGGSLREEELVIERNSSTSAEEESYGLNLYRLTAPKKRSVDSDDAVEALQSLLSISADAAVAYDPDAAALERYGLSEPYSTADFTYLDEEEKTVRIQLAASAADSDGNVYLLREGVPLVYQVAASSLPWYDKTYPDFVATLQLLPNITTVSQMVVETSAGKSYTFDLSFTPGEEEDDDEQVQFLYEGRPLDDKQFRQFYQSIIGLPGEEYATEQPPAESEALLKATFHYRDSKKKPDTIALLPGPARKVFLSINGEAEFYTRSAYLDTILGNCEKIINGEKVDPLY